MSSSCFILALCAKLLKSIAKTDTCEGEKEALTSKVDELSNALQEKSTENQALKDKITELEEEARKEGKHA